MGHPKVKVRDKDKGWKQLFEAAKAMGGEHKVKVGFLADGKAGAVHPGSALTVAEIAAVLEFGTEDGHVPARPLLRPTFDEQRGPLAELGGKLFAGVLFGKMTLMTALGILGAKLAAEVKKKATAGPHIPPPNAPSTVAAKGSDRPWIDTSRTINSISWSVESGKKE